MEKKKAITITQQRQLKRSIYETAVKIFVDRGFHYVTFANIAKSLGINRTILYYYYKNEADVLLDYLANKLGELYANVGVDNSLNLSPLYHIVGIIDLDTDFKQVAGIFSSVLEPRASYEALVSFRQSFHESNMYLKKVSQEFHPGLSDELFHKYNSFFIVMFIGASALNTYDKRVQKISKKVGYPYFRIGICEVCLIAFKDEPHFENSIEYWEKIAKLVREKDNDKYL